MSKAIASTHEWYWRSEKPSYTESRLSFDGRVIWVCRMCGKGTRYPNTINTPCKRPLEGDSEHAPDAGPAGA